MASFVDMGKLAKDINYWPLGYQEPFETIAIEPLLKALNEISGDTCLEIGCGNGYWTRKLLVPKFKKVIAVDIIEPLDFGFDYYQQDSLKDIPEVDAVYSFGVFCHLKRDERMTYLLELRKILKGKGLISFGNWQRHPGLTNAPNGSNGWYYDDVEIVDYMMKIVGFEWYDFDPSYRDTIAIIC